MDFPAGNLLDLVRRADRPGVAAEAGRRRGETAMQRLVGEQSANCGEEFRWVVPIGVKSNPQPALLDSLSVVVLIPKQGQHDHWTAEVDALGHGVVAAVRDDHLSIGEHRRLR